MIWSPEPKESYTVQIGDEVVGIGTHQAFQLPGAWNIFWLFAAKRIEQYRDKNLPPEQHIDSIGALYPAVLLAIQPINFDGYFYLGALAEDITPMEFLKFMSNIKELQAYYYKKLKYADFLSTAAYGLKLFDEHQEAAAKAVGGTREVGGKRVKVEYAIEGEKVIRVNFRGRVLNASH